MVGRLGGMLGEQRLERDLGPLVEHLTVARAHQQQLAQIRAVAEMLASRGSRSRLTTGFHQHRAGATSARAALGGGGIADPRQSVRDLISDLNHIPL